MEMGQLEGGDGEGGNGKGETGGGQRGGGEEVARGGGIFTDGYDLYIWVGHRLQD